MRCLFYCEYNRVRAALFFEKAVAPVRSACDRIDWGSNQGLRLSDISSKNKKRTNAYRIRENEMMRRTILRAATL